MRVRLVMVSTILLVWSFTTLLITKGWASTNGSRNTIDKISTTQRHYDLIQMPDIDDEGADGFDHNPTMMKLEAGVGRHDRSHKYIIYDHVVVGSEFISLSHSFGVTLCTISSIDRLYWLAETSSLWDGPVSIAVFVFDHEIDILQTYISYLRSCFRYVRERVSFSLAHPLHSSPNHSPEVDSTISNWVLPCSDPRNTLNKLLGLIKKKPKDFEFPQNHLRNIARESSLTHYSLSLDVDIFPSPGMAKVLARFLNRNTCVKCAFVIPTYEIHHKAIFPANKTALLRLVKKLQARPYHSKVFIHNQFATNFSQ